MFNAAEKLWMKTGNLLVLTINVNAEVVVQDAEADQELLEPGSERVLDSEPHDPGGWNQHDLSVGRARHIGCRLGDVGIQRVDGVHARFPGAADSSVLRYTGA